MWPSLGKVLRSGAEVSGSLRVGGQPGLCRKPCLETQNKGGGGEAEGSVQGLFLTFHPSSGKASVLGLPEDTVVAQKGCSHIASCLQRTVAALASEPHGGQCCVL